MDSTNNIEDTLYLTPMISDGKKREAKKLSYVQPFLGNIKSYSGLLTVDEIRDAHMFFWYFPAETNDKDTPLILWLNGWSTPSTFSVFTQTGPYYVDSKKKLNLNEFSWHKLYNVLYLDNPLGTGFSFTKNIDGYSTTQYDIGLDLYKALRQFYDLFDDLQSNELYLAGLSYAGKYITSLGYHIHRNNLKREFIINLKGLFLGNPLIDPLNQFEYGNYLYELGFINENEREIFLKTESTVKDLIKNENYQEACEEMMNCMYRDDSVFFRQTGLPHYYNYIDDYVDPEYWRNFITQTEVRKRLHVGDIEFQDGSNVTKLLKHDIPKSNKHYLEELVEHYKIFIYNGQYDIVCGYTMLVNMALKLQWSGSAEFAKSMKTIWKDEEKLMGYITKYENLIIVLVRGSGHMVPSDNPKLGLRLLNMFINKEY